ncbi:unnamed protein product [Clonostachys byssicola]|uniref:F-box domain-containing protein n=1 Tax=Clonostachys byssicola TaxID=160290 RepID=A0A9N9ULD2_9HYPO|nr:unnamed protein product [Clonostachys byssicola]
MAATMRRSERIASRAREKARLANKRSPKAQQVFATPELLETILRMVEDMPTMIASAPLVCRAWKNHIDTSPALQRDLFFAQDLKTTMSDPDADVSFRLNPLLTQHFGALIKVPLNFDYTRLGSGEEAMLDIKKLVKTGMSITKYKAQNLRKTGLSVNKHKGRSLHDKFSYKGASWRRMLITQPPARKIGLVRPHEDWHTPSILETSVLVEGLRMGQFWDTVYHTLWGEYSATAYNRKIRIAYRVGSPDAHLWARGANSTHKCHRKIIADIEFLFEIIETSSSPYSD